VLEGSAHIIEEWNTSKDANFDVPDDLRIMCTKSYVM
jgi:hypothetical protein